MPNIYLNTRTQTRKTFCSLILARNKNKYERGFQHKNCLEKHEIFPFKPKENFSILTFSNSCYIDHIVSIQNENTGKPF